MCFSFMFQPFLSASAFWETTFRILEIFSTATLMASWGGRGKPWQLVKKHGDIQGKIMDNQWEIWKDPWTSPSKWCFNAENQGKWRIWQNVWFPAGYPQRIGRQMRWDIIQRLIGSMIWCASWWWWWWWFPLHSLEHLQYINTSLDWIGTGASISIQISCRWKSAN